MMGFAAHYMRSMNYCVQQTVSVNVLYIDNDNDSTAYCSPEAK